MRLLLNEDKSKIFYTTDKSDTVDVINVDGSELTSINSGSGRYWGIATDSTVR